MPSFHSPSKQLSDGRCHLLFFLTTLVCSGSTPSSRSVDPYEDISSSPLSPLHCDPDKVKDRQDKYFKIQLGLKLDTVSLDKFEPSCLRLDSVSNLPPPCGQHPAQTAIWTLKTGHHSSETAKMEMQDIIRCSCSPHGPLCYLATLSPAPVPGP